MKKLFILSVVLLSLTIAVFAQAPDTLWTRTYGGSGDDSASDIIMNSDGYYIVVGGTSSYGSGSGDVYFLKIDDNGDTLWTRTYGGESIECGYCVRETSDSGYIISGYTHSFGPSSDNVYLIKTNSNGDTIWTRAFGSGGTDAGYGVQQTSDGGYIITSYITLNSVDVYLIKTDSFGDTIWTRTFGGTEIDYGWSVQQTTDGGYIIAGETSSYGASSSDVYLIKTNANGDTSWTNTFGGSGDDGGKSVQQTADGGYIIAGYTGSYGAGYRDVYLIKTDANGNESWSQTFGGTGDDRGESIQQTADGGYIIAGFTESFGAGHFDVYLVKTDNTGNEIWLQTIGGSNYDFGYSVQETLDGGYIIAGYTNSYGAGVEDAYLIKLEPDNLSGALSGTLSASEYHVTGDITVADGDSLIIEPGTTLLFDGNYSFDIDGYLYAVGTEADSIKFRPDDPDSTWGGWILMEAQAIRVDLDIVI